MIGDLDGNGLDDIVVFDKDRIRYSLNNNGNLEDKKSYGTNAGIFTFNGGDYTDQSIKPRIIANIVGVTIIFYLILSLYYSFYFIILLYYYHYYY